MALIRTIEETWSGEKKGSNSKYMGVMDRCTQTFGHIVYIPCQIFCTLKTFEGNKLIVFQNIGLW